MLKESRTMRSQQSIFRGSSSIISPQKIFADYGTGKQSHNQIVKNPFVQEEEDEVVINLKPFSDKLFIQNKKPIRTGGPNGSFWEVLNSLQNQSYEKQMEQEKKQRK